MHVQRTILEGSSNWMLQLTPSVPHLVLHYPEPIKVPCSTRVNDSLCFVAGNRTKGNDNNRSIKLSSSEHISSFRQPTRGLKCTYCTLAPQAAGGPGTHQPLGGQRGLDKWLEQTSLSPVREEPPYSKRHHPNSIFLFMPVVDTASCDWRHALHRLIGILNWKTAGEKCKKRHPEHCHKRTISVSIPI